MSRDLLHALAGAAVGLIVSLAFEMLAGRDGPVTDWLGETLDEQLQRRLAACETSVQELWKAHNARDASDG